MKWVLGISLLVWMLNVTSGRRLSGRMYGGENWNRLCGPVSPYYPSQPFDGVGPRWSGDGTCFNEGEYCKTTEECCVRWFPRSKLKCYFGSCNTNYPGIEFG